jgi:hypothetical protein
MPQLVAVALLGAGLYAGYRWLARASGQIAAELERAESELLRRAAATGGTRAKDMGRLEYDPVSGVYRPVDLR